MCPDSVLSKGFIFIFNIIVEDKYFLSSNHPVKSQYPYFTDKEPKT